MPEISMTEQIACVEKLAAAITVSARVAELNAVLATLRQVERYVARFDENFLDSEFCIRPPGGTNPADSDGGANRDTLTTPIRDPADYPGRY